MLSIIYQFMVTSNYRCRCIIHTVSYRLCVHPLYVTPVKDFIFLKMFGNAGSVDKGQDVTPDRNDTKIFF